MTDEVTPRSALAYALVGAAPYNQAEAVLKRLEAIGWTVSRPPKPEEPTGLGAVVEDAEGRRWVRADFNDETWAQAGADEDDENFWCDYADINAVRVLSEGGQPC